MSRFLEINEYEKQEQIGTVGLSNRAIQSFCPVTFGAMSYPIRVSSEAEILRYVDTMHETKNGKYFTPGFFLSSDEASLIRKVTDAAYTLTHRQYGRGIRPWMAPFAALPLFRVIKGFSSFHGKPISVFELGPGSGYLGALLLASGHRYGAMDNSQAFYLWQNRFFQELMGNEFSEWAEPGVSDSKMAVHIPWWKYAAFHRGCPIRMDVFVCDHAMGEMSKFALKYTIRLAAQVLAESRLPLFLSTSIGQMHVSKEDDIEKEFLAAGFFRLRSSSQIMAFALKNSDLAKYGRLLRDPNRSIAKRVFSKLGFGNQSVPAYPAGLEWLDRASGAPNYNPSGRGGSLTAQAVIDPISTEAPVDYEFLEFLGSNTPLTRVRDSTRKH